MNEPFQDFCRYYRDFGAEFLAQLWETWRTEVWPAVLIAILVFFLSYRHDTNAKTALLYTTEACGIYLVGWALYHLIRTPWKLSLKTAEIALEASFKTKVLELSASILDFFYERARNMPALPGKRFHFFGRDPSSMLQEMVAAGAQQEARKKYELETLGIYAYKFSRDVMATITALDDMGLRDDTMNKFWDNPPQSDTIKIIGERLGILADRILEE